MIRPAARQPRVCFDARMSNRSGHGLLILAITTLASTPLDARASNEVLKLGAGVDLVGTLGDLNMGEQVGEDGDGESDLTGRRLGLVANAGVRSGRFQIGAEVGLAIGGLHLTRIEEEYYGSSGEQLGSAGVASAAASLRYQLHDRDRRWQPFIGGGAGLSRMWASSPSGSARVDMIFLEPSIGVQVASGTRGAFVATMGLRVERVLRASLGTISNGFVSPEDPAMMLSPRLLVGYEYSL